MGADKKKQLGACLGVGATAKQLAETGDFPNEAEFGAVGVDVGALQSTEDDHLAVLNVNKGGGLPFADDGLGVAVDGDVIDDIFNFLVNLELDVTIFANEGRDL